MAPNPSRLTIDSNRSAGQATERNSVYPISFWYSRAVQRRAIHSARPWGRRPHNQICLGPTNRHEHELPFEGVSFRLFVRRKARINPSFHVVTLHPKFLRTCLYNPTWGGRCRHPRSLCPRSRPGAAVLRHAPRCDPDQGTQCRAPRARPA